MKKKLTIHNYRKHYDGDYNHSTRLKDVFGVFNYQGVDLITDNGVKVEFKESFRYNIPESKVKFSVYSKDLEADLIIFVYKDWSYICFSDFFRKEYEFKKGIAQPYLSTIKSNSIRRFDSLERLKIYLEKILVVMRNYT